MRHRIVLFVLSGFLLLAADGLAQKKKKYKAPKDPVKTAQKKEQMEGKQLDREIRKLKKAHRKLQGKKAAKRMKRNHKRSSRHSQGKKEPLLKRLFRGKRKKVKAD